MFKNPHISFSPNHQKTDLILMVLTVLLTLFGLVMIYEASNVSAYGSFNDKFHFVKDQSVWAFIGIVNLIILSRVHYKHYFSLAVPFLTFTLITLVFVLIPGIGLKALGARRWIEIGNFSFQPSELAKLSLILYLSAWLESKEKGRFLQFMALFALIVGLVVLQPDLGTAIILSSIFLVVYFISNAPFWHFLILVPASLISVIILALISPYRYQRLLTFLNPSLDPMGSSYHIRQILISLGSGGFFGLGLGASRQKYQYLPEATTDSIFAIIGEEFGFLGTIIFIFIYIYLIYRIFKIVKNAPDKFSFLLSAGIMSLIGFQVIINLGAMVALFPLTGIPLPFISYGGTNLIMTMSAIGILLNIARYGKARK